MFNRTVVGVNSQIHRVQAISEYFHYQWLRSPLQCRVKVLEPLKFSHGQTRVMRLR